MPSSTRLGAGQRDGSDFVGKSQIGHVKFITAQNCGVMTRLLPIHTAMASKLAEVGL